MFRKRFVHKNKDVFEILIFKLDNYLKKKYSKDILLFIHTIESCVLKELSIIDRNFRQHVIKDSTEKEKEVRTNNM